MARVLNKENNLMIFADELSGSDVGLYYRMPTTRERQGYTNAAVKRGAKGNKITFHVVEAKIEFGAKILTGIRDGDFLLENGRPLSSDPTSENYIESWKDIVIDCASDLVGALATKIFDHIPDVAGTEEEDIEGE
ncbi:MAG: hypothetical protein EOL92_00445 [Bacteroidia bacterium]|nr:hypothetical protein [Bacteroidia bacterium]